MMNKIISPDLLKILSKANENKIYGSVEIFFESGRVTQITQRIINKVHGVKVELRKAQNDKRAFSKLSKNKVAPSEEVISHSQIIN